MIELTALNNEIKKRLIELGRASGINSVVDDKQLITEMQELLAKPKSENDVETLTNGRFVQVLADDMYISLPSNEFRIGDRNEVHNNKFYLQGEAGSCAAWAFANTFLSLGFDISPQFMLINLAMSFEGEHVVTFRGESLVTDPDELVEDLEFPGLVTKHKLERYTTFEEAVVENARIIKDIIDSKKVMFLGVNSSVLYLHLDFDEEGGHAITINGYRVGRGGRMEVHIYDSNLGGIWVALELITLGAGFRQRVFYRR